MIYVILTIGIVLVNLDLLDMMLLINNYKYLK